MDLKVVFAVVCLCVLAITSSNAGIPKCCIKTRNVAPFVQRKVERWEMQHSSGVCDIDALKLYVKGLMRPICAKPSLMKHLMKNMKKPKMTQRQNGLTH